MKKGISLVVLVITIIVLIVLTTTVLLVFREDGIIDRAREATFKSDFSNIRNSFMLNKLNNMMENSGTNITTKDVEEIKNNIPLLKTNANKKIYTRKYDELLQIKDSVLYQSSIISSSSNEKDNQISQWLTEIGILEIPLTNEENINGEWEIEIIDEVEKTCKIIKYNGEQLNNVEIPDRIEGYTVIELGNTEKIAEFTGSITIPNSVTKIGQSAFSGCSGLTSITIPDKVTRIGSGAFSNCSGLTSITIPDSVTILGNTVFESCKNLSSITISNNITEIKSEVFRYCESLSSITIPKSVTSIRSDAFWNCNNLKEINVDEDNANFSSKDGVLFNKNKTAIIKYPEGITNSTYEIPNGVTNINSYAFFDCTKLTNITISNSVTSIAVYAFSGCNNLKEINVNEENANFSSENGIIFNKDKTAIIKYPEGITNSTYEIPNGVTSIGSYAFTNCTKLTDIIIPVSVTSIGEYAFRACSGLTSIIMPVGVISIGQSAFIYCNGLKSITIPNSVTSIGAYAFQSCSGLTSITIPNSVTSIGEYAFLYSNYNLEITVDKYQSDCVGFNTNWNRISENNMTYYNVTYKTN